MTDSQHKDAAYGALLGAAVGDAAGAVLEFIYRYPTAEEVEAALGMPGGGVWEVGPGQITDDAEMALCLAQALAGHPASGPVPLDQVAAWYAKWLFSPPFDIGETTRAALSAARGHPQGVVEGLAAKMQQRAAEYNQESLSNGCLMRITPMAVWSHRLGPDGVAANAAADASITHPKKGAQIATGAYCIAIAHLINNPRDAAGALTATQHWLSQGLAAALATEQLQQQARSSSNGGGSIGGSCRNSAAGSVHSAHSSSTGSTREHDADIPEPESKAWGAVLEWLAAAQQEGPGPEVHVMAGYCKWGFVHSFRALSLKLPFDEAMRQVLLLGGDTDTNAAIVGGVIGAYWGAAAIPGRMKDPLLARSTASPGRKRPGFLQTGRLHEMFEKLWEAAGR